METTPLSKEIRDALTSIKNEKQISDDIRNKRVYKKNTEDFDGHKLITYEKIDFADFRNEYKISSSKLRMIVRDLDLKIERVYDKQYIVGQNKHNVSNIYYLKHAVLEYKATGYINRTLEGKWYETEQETKVGHAGLYTIETGGMNDEWIKQETIKENPVGIGVSSLKEENIIPVMETYSTTPIKQSDKVLISRDLLEKLAYELEKIHSNQQSNRTESKNAIEKIETNLNIEKSDRQNIDSQVMNLAYDIFGCLKDEISKKQGDILYTQNKLLEVEEKGFVISTEQVGALLGMSKATISSKPAEFIKLGFTFTKVKEGNATYWSVARYNVKKNENKKQ
jgi:hypothetical protein